MQHCSALLEATEDYGRVSEREFNEDMRIARQSAPDDAYYMVFMYQLSLMDMKTANESLVVHQATTEGGGGHWSGTRFISVVASGSNCRHLRTEIDVFSPWAASPGFVFGFFHILSVCSSTKQMISVDVCTKV